MPLNDRHRQAAAARAAGWSLRQIEREIGVGRVALRALERGEHRDSAEWLALVESLRPAAEAGDPIAASRDAARARVEMLRKRLASGIDCAAELAAAAKALETLEALRPQALAAPARDDGAPIDPGLELLGLRLMDCAAGLGLPASLARLSATEEIEAALEGAVGAEAAALICRRAREADPVIRDLPGRPLQSSFLGEGWAPLSLEAALEAVLAAEGRP